MCTAIRNTGYAFARLFVYCSVGGTFLYTEISILKVLTLVAIGVQLQRSIESLILYKYYIIISWINTIKKDNRIVIHFAPQFNCLCEGQDALPIKHKFLRCSGGLVSPIDSLLEITI